MLWKITDILHYEIINTHRASSLPFLPSFINNDHFPFAYTASAQYSAHKYENKSRKICFLSFPGSSSYPNKLEIIKRIYYAFLFDVEYTDPLFNPSDMCLLL